VPRRGPRPARRACSTNGASFLRNAAAFFLFKSISYSVPPTENRTVSAAGPPSKSSSSVTVIFVVISTSTALATRTLLIKSEARSHPAPPVPAASHRHHALRRSAMGADAGRQGSPTIAVPEDLRSRQSSAWTHRDYTF